MRRRIFKVACLGSVIGSLLLPLTAHGEPERYRDRGRDRHGPEIHRSGHVVHELPAGYRALEIHGIRYYERGGVYFQPVADGYLIVDAPGDVTAVAAPGLGTISTTLPIGSVALQVGRDIYYRHGNIFYRRQNDQYLVVERPSSVVMVESQPAPPQVISAGPAPTSVNDNYVSVWVGGQEFMTRGGSFYRNSPGGLKLVEAPIGAVVSAPPAGSLNLWIAETEYFYFNSAFYQKSPAGYRIVAPPLNAYIKVIPSGAKTIFASGQKYFELGGNFYQQRDQGYLIATPPVFLTAPSLSAGTLVAAPPDGAIDLWVNDLEYLYFAGNFYRKQPAGYVVVGNPL